MPGSMMEERKKKEADIQRKKEAMALRQFSYDPPDGSFRID